MFSSKNTWMIWHIFQNPLWGKTDREEKKEILTCKNSLLIWILTPLLPALFPFLSLFRNTPMRVQIAERASRAATKAGEMKYFTLSPGFPLRLKSSATFFHRLCTTTACAPLRVCTHVNVHMHARAHAYTRQTKEEETKCRKGVKKQDLGCLWVCFTPTLFCFASPPPWQGTGRLEQQSECDVTLCWGLYSARLLLICKLT